MVSARVVLALAACLALAVANTHAQATCGWNGYDFSSLATADIAGSDGGSTYAYYLRLCGPLTSQPTCTTVQSTAASCQIQVQPKGQSFVTGNWPPATQPQPKWGYIDNNNPSLGVTYQMVGAQACWASGSPTDYYSNVVLTCAQTAGTLKVLVPSLSCSQNYTLATPLACASTPGGGGGGTGGAGGGESKSGLSGGWIFIIIVCVLIPVYVAVGCVYKSQKLGATGTDMCPNVEFWRDLPSLIKDGFVFTFTKLRGLCGGGGGGGAKGDGSYETM